MAQKETAALFQVLSRFPPDDVRHAIPAIVFELVQTHPDVNVPAPVAEAVSTWMASKGLNQASTPANVVAALQDHYKKKPINKALKEGLADLLQALAGETGTQGFRAFTGDKATVAPAPAVPPPAGAVKNNPLARFALKTDKEKKNAR